MGRMINVESNNWEGQSHVWAVSATFMQLPLFNWTWDGHFSIFAFKGQNILIKGVYIFKKHDKFNFSVVSWW